MALGSGITEAGLFKNTIGPGSVPWTGGVVPYVWDASVAAGLRETYLAGLKEWELAGNITWVERTTETEFMTLKYDSSAAAGSYDPTTKTLTMIALNRRLVCHESGHGLGLEHEHSRPDRDTYVNVIYGNIQTAAHVKFDIIPTSTTNGGYDFESVMHYEYNEYSTDPMTLNSMEPQAGFELFARRMSNMALSSGDLAVITHLYGAGPTLSPVVTNTDDTGVGSLRAALYYANDHPGTTISFNIPNTDPGFSGGVYTIALTGNLPTVVANGTIIDGTTQSEYAASPVIAISGEALIAEALAVNGLTIYGSNCEVRGLSIYGFSNNGIGMFYAGASSNIIEGCFIGVKPDGSTASANSKQGVAIWGGATNNRVGTDATTAPGRNVISGNGEYGVLVLDSTTSGNVIAGNYIGTDAAGLNALGNAKSGVGMWGATTGNQVGGTTVQERNILSGNLEYGVWISESGTSTNTIAGNRIGTNVSGDAAVPNSLGGVILTQASTQNTIGPGNVVSGNSGAGLHINGVGTDDNMIEGNLFGTNAAGTSGLTNNLFGILVDGGAEDNLICENVLSGNSSEGIRLGGAGTSGNRIEANLIGTDPSGTVGIPNSFAGVGIFGGATNNIVGATTPGRGNTVSGNSLYGIVLGDSSTSGNLIEGNWVGVASDFTPLGNTWSGVAIRDGASGNTIGGTATGATNIIANNGLNGVALFDPGTVGNSISQNALFSNSPAGISIGSSNNGQSAPSLASCTLGATGITISGTLTSVASTAFRIEFFRSDAPGTGDGRYFLGAIAPLMTDGSGNAGINDTLAAFPPIGSAITATATNLSTGDTSALSGVSLVGATDSDSDGMPDAYESANGLNPAVDDASLDLDGDGIPNIEEMIAGTDPQDPTSKIGPLQIVNDANGNTITLPNAEPGRVYTFLKRDELGTGGWVVLATGLSRSTSGPILVVDRYFDSADQRFYKVVGE